MKSGEEKMLFLLGGADLEMLTIKSLLEKENTLCADHKLTWENSRLSAYRDELIRYSGDGWDIYGIELKNDMPDVPENYHEIDHHGIKDHMPSSLEQVAALLHHTLTFQEKMIAANDRGHVRAMRSLLDTALEAGTMSEEDKEEMIARIRRDDRMAQGVTEEEENTAAEEIRQGPYFQNGDLIIFKTCLSRFSPIADRLSGYDRIAIFNDDKFTIYGQGCHVAGVDLADRYGLWGCCYSGGGPLGYWGVPEGVMSKEKIEEAMKMLKSMKIQYSGHIFYFPFIWKLRSGGKGFPYFKLNHWRRASDDMLYDEKNYFYPFVHDVLYDEGNNSMMRHFEMSCGPDSRYEIKVRNAGRMILYSLSLKSLNLNLYSTGAGLLSFYLADEDNHCEEDGKRRLMDQDDILKVNQYGRRIMLPFFGDKESRNETAAEIRISGLDGFTSLKEDFSGYAQGDSWKPASFITALITDLSDDLDFKPAIDDRMFVMSWYRNTALVKRAVMDMEHGSSSSDSHFWYRYLYVDGSYATCQNEDMRNALINEATYKRWTDYGSLYGITRYSMVLLTSDSVPGHLLNTFETIYARMAEMVLVQRVALLNFSEEASKVSSELTKDDREVYGRIQSLYSEYIAFVNRFYHREVTAQDQGIEIYAMMQKALRMDEFVKDLDNDIGELYQYMSMVEDRSQGRKADSLNWIMGIFAPASFVAGIWGMNEMCDVYCSDSFWKELVWIVLVAGLTYLFVHFYNRNKK